jgi:hypothetical protein
LVLDTKNSRLEIVSSCTIRTVRRSSPLLYENRICLDLGFLIECYIDLHCCYSGFLVAMRKKPKSFVSFLLFLYDVGCNARLFKIGQFNYNAVYRNGCLGFRCLLLAVPSRRNMSTNLKTWPKSFALTETIINLPKRSHKSCPLPNYKNLVSLCLFHRQLLVRCRHHEGTHRRQFRGMRLGTVSDQGECPGGR